jgi:uncharacterized membrane protein YoaK (UPF0700 family)
MPLFYLRRLTSTERTDAANRHLARYLALIAGATNAGGFLAVHKYTSHMSGIVATAADDLALGNWRLAMDAIFAVSAFFAGACSSAVLIRWGRERGLASQYALPLVTEAALLVVFGVVGREFMTPHVLGTVLLLCYTMGLQNAMITKISGSVIRTTHLTGMVTDMGIAVGWMAYLPLRGEVSVSEEWATLRLLGSLVGLFLVGGVTGALGFRHAGFLFTVPLAAVVLALAIVPVVDDLRRARAEEE